jgi:hypothetical protein
VPAGCKKHRACTVEFDKKELRRRHSNGELDVQTLAAPEAKS